jgi:hypothetical protein
MKATEYNQPWQHWIADDFLTVDCLAEVKAVRHTVPQLVHGKRVGSNRLFIDDSQVAAYPELHRLWRSLHNGKYKEFFEQYTGINYTNLFPRVEVVSDIGPFYLEPHCDLQEKCLTALVYTNYEQLYPGTNLYPDHRVESQDNRCLFFVPGNSTWHGYEATEFPKVRRCLQINYWTYSA